MTENRSKIPAVTLIIIVTLFRFSPKKAGRMRSMLAEQNTALIAATKRSWKKAIAESVLECHLKNSRMEPAKKKAITIRKVNIPNA